MFPIRNVYLYSLSHVEYERYDLQKQVKIVCRENHYVVVFLVISLLFRMQKYVFYLKAKNFIIAMIEDLLKIN
jgi:hypothetical protein